MAKMQPQNADFLNFKKQYSNVLKEFLTNKKSSKNYLQKGHELGQKAAASHLGMLSIAAIHYDCLSELLEKLNIEKNTIATNKADKFLEECLAAFHINEKELHTAVKLLDNVIKELITHKHDEEEYKFAAKKLELSLSEKEQLLQEMSHRVKNNLQMISSLLNLEVETTKDPAAQQVLIESAARVKSAALIHEMLYKTDKHTQIKIREYLQDLFGYLYKIYDINPERIKYKLDVDDILLNIDQAIPFGLIINEFISNSLKHAFPNNRSGELTLSLKKHHDQITLIVSDNGIGMQPDIDIKNIPSLGMQLIINLTKQLNGKLELDRNQGTTFKVSVKQ